MKNRLDSHEHKGIISFFQQFVRLQSFSAILLLIVTALALLWANSPLSGAYFALWGSYLTIGIEQFELSKPLLLWINDGLMAIFFFVVGLEIKREVLGGELASLRRAVLPLAAAIGGMAAPALLYTALNAGQSSAVGWGIPMATDIAFTLGVLALLGSRAPVALKVFVTALAIVDDIGAVLVIALFYTSKIVVSSLYLAAVVMILLIILNRLGVKRILPYLLLGLVLWVAFVTSGVHATIAGILLAFTIPACVNGTISDFVSEAEEALKIIRHPVEDTAIVSSEEQRQAAAQALDHAAEEIESPLHNLEHDLHPWVSYFILPVFALANAGVRLDGGEFLRALGHPIALGIIVGLLIGKSFGVSAMTWLAVRLGWAELPPGITWRQNLGAATLSGIGFTMSIFIANLAFGEGEFLSIAKVGIIIGSLLAGVIGWLLLRTSSL